MRRWLVAVLLVCLVVLSGLLWGALRAFDVAAGVQAFSRLPDHDYLADIETLRQQGKLAEALALSDFVCAQPTYPQQSQACVLAQELRAQTQRFWYRARSVGYGALTGTAVNGWALAGATTADFLVVGDVRDLLVQSWRLARGQDADELLMLLSAVGVLTVTAPSLDWVPSFSKMAVRLGALSKRLTDQLVMLSRRAVAMRRLTPLQGVFDDVGHLVRRLGPTKTLEVLPVLETTDDVATAARLASTHPERLYGLLKVGGRSALTTLASVGPDAAADVVQAARKGAPGLHIFQRFGRRMFTTHLVIGASKALHRGRLPQAMSLWLAAQTPRLRLLVTVLLASAWFLTLMALWRIWRGRMRDQWV